MKPPVQSNPQTNGHDGPPPVRLARDTIGLGQAPQLQAPVRAVSTAGPALVRSIVDHLRRSKLVQWLLAYLGVAWLTLQLVETLGDIWDWPVRFQRVTSLVLGLLFFPAAVIAWYHGEQGRQRVCCTEVALVVVLTAVSFAVAWRWYW